MIMHCSDLILTQDVKIVQQCEVEQRGSGGAQGPDEGTVVRTRGICLGGVHTDVHGAGMNRGCS